MKYEFNHCLTNNNQLPLTVTLVLGLKQLISNFANIGVRPTYKPWESHLVRKLNVMALIGFMNVSLGIIIFLVFGYHEFIPECIFILLLAPLIPLFNLHKNYIWSAYMFYINGWILFTLFGLKMGLDSLAFLLFFPVILSLMQLLARRELLKHLIANFVICFVFILLLIFGSKQQFLFINPSTDMVNTLKYINVFFSFTVTLSFLIVLTMEGAKQEKQIHNMLKEKEVLLAEVFHRVKNNMNIVTSLLNLKKNASDSEVVKQALEECKNRVYSMALVHQNIYKTNNFTDLDMKEYIHDLVDELIDSHGTINDTDISVKCEDIALDIAKAVPFGLILNELITNSFKYARISGSKLRIEIALSIDKEIIRLSYSDNGPGIKEILPKKNSLGIELIKSLSEQVDGEYEFKNNNGFKFELKFKIK